MQNANLFSCNFFKFIAAYFENTASNKKTSIHR